MSVSKIVLLLLAAALGALLAAGCRAPTAEDETKLVVYSGRSESLVGPLLAKFEEQSGLEIAVRYGSTAELAATLLEEGSNSPADIFYAQDPGGLGAVTAAGLLTELPTDSLSRLPEQFVDPNDRWAGVSGRARVVVYNSERIQLEDLPPDLRGFTEPAWNGRLGWAPTNGSFQAMITGMRAMWGEELTREWLRGIQANNPIPFENNTAIVAAVGTAEIDVGLVNHYYLYRFLAEEGESFPARNYFLATSGPGSLIMVSGVGILETAAHPENAQKLLEFLLSEEAQSYFAAETYEYPLVEGSAPPPTLPTIETLSANAAEIDLTALSDVGGTIDLLNEVGILP